jgi:hypothetical protein
MIVSASVTKLSTLASSFEKMKIGIDLENAAFEGNTLIHISLQTSFKQKRSVSEIIKWVKSKAMDNADLMAETIGDDLTCRIIKFSES